METRLKLGYGRQSFPDNVRAVWGARLIFPNDLVWDRQDLAAHDDRAKEELLLWLNGVPEGYGAIREMKLVLGSMDIRYEKGITADMPFEKEVVIYEDDEGKIVGSAQGSHGYLYVAGWLKEYTNDGRS